MTAPALELDARVALEPVTFCVDGKIVPWARAGRRGGFSYTPSHVRKYQDWVKVCASRAMEGRQLLLGPVCLNVDFSLPIAASWPFWKQEAAEYGMIAPTSRPDLDNFLKSIGDACNLVVWQDDSQIVSITATKSYGLKPGARVEVRPIQTVKSAADWRRHQSRRAALSEPAGDLFGGAL